MNSKKTNYLVSILNSISIVAFYVLALSNSYITSSILPGEESGKSIYNSFAVEFLLNNIQLILAIFFGILGILNIICAVQNRNNKKLCFWQATFGTYKIWTAIGVSLLLDNENIAGWGNKILLGIIPIIFAVKNLILIKKNKPGKIYIISYILAIVLSIIHFLNIGGEYWSIVFVIMQFIYIHKQDNYQESKTRKIINIILYYISQSIVVIGFVVILATALITTKVNDVKWTSELTELCVKVQSLQGVDIVETYIPVEKNYKYGFINESGQELIPCKYDRVSYFNEVEINNKKYYIALVEENNNFYIISKKDEAIEIDGNLKKYLNTIKTYMDSYWTKKINEDGNYRNAYLIHMNFCFQVLLARNEINLTAQTLEINNYNSSVNLSESDSKYYYNNNNYTMIIEPINNDTENEYGNYYESDYSSSRKSEYNVTIIKSNGESQSSIVHLPGFYENDATIDTFTNGYIEFESTDSTKIGWYDNNGNQTTIINKYDESVKDGKYEIKDIKDNKAILQINNYENYDKKAINFIIIDMNGQVLLQTIALDIYDNIYLSRDNNGKMILLDKDLNIISNEYDKIITNNQIDISPSYSSYY